LPALSHWSPLFGLLAWFGLAVRLGPGVADEVVLAELLVAFLPLVIVPLVLPLTVVSDRSPGTGARWAAVLTYAHIVGALAVLIGAFAVPTGTTLALALALVWLGFTALAGLHGLRRLATRRNRFQLAELAIDLGLLILPVAGAWLLVYRGELVFQGFGGLAALLTAAHFHAAGFGTMIVVGLVGRGLADAGLPRARRLHQAITPLLMLAFPMLAAGIASAIRPIELLGAGLYALGLPLLAGLQMAAALGLRGRPPMWRALLSLSSLAVLLATGFAARFAMQGFYGEAVPIPTMLRWHAAVNVFGFLGLGLLAWSRLRPPQLADRPQ
jgi:hypothetical protein